MQTARHLVKFRTATSLVQACKTACISSLRLVHRNFTASSTENGPEEAKISNRQSRVDLAAAFRGLEMMNFAEGICNHLSLMAPAANGHEKVMLMLPYGYHWKEVNLIHLLMCDNLHMLKPETSKRTKRNNRNHRNDRNNYRNVPETNIETTETNIETTKTI
jgi:hypothetical protein